MGDGEAEFSDGVEDLEKEADAVHRLDLDCRVIAVLVVGEEHAHGELAPPAGQGFGFFPDAFGNGGGEVDGLAGTGAGHEFADRFGLPLVGDGFEVGGADVEDIQHQIVGAEEEVGAQDVDGIGGEGSGDFGEEQRTVPSDENEFAGSLFGAGAPFEDGCQGAETVVLALLAVEGAEGFEVARDGGGGAVGRSKLPSNL